MDLGSGPPRVPSHSERCPETELSGSIINLLRGIDILEIVLERYLSKMSVRL